MSVEVGLGVLNGLRVARRHRFSPGNVGHEYVRFGKAECFGLGGFYWLCGWRLYRGGAMRGRS